MTARMNEYESMFLKRLLRWRGCATPQELGPQICNQENSARQSCKRKGWVTFDRNYWRITDAGRAALKFKVAASE
jgi:hypothetical protein